METNWLRTKVKQRHCIRRKPRPCDLLFEFRSTIKEQGIGKLWHFSHHVNGQRWKPKRNRKRLRKGQRNTDVCLELTNTPQRASSPERSSLGCPYAHSLPTLHFNKCILTLNVEGKVFFVWWLFTIASCWRTGNRLTNHTGRPITKLRYPYNEEQHPLVAYIQVIFPLKINFYTVLKITNKNGHNTSVSWLYFLNLLKNFSFHESNQNRILYCEWKKN